MRCWTDDFADLLKLRLHSLSAWHPKTGTDFRNSHATNFVAHDSSIPVGIRAMIEVLLEYLRTMPIH
jgi:hypothetical protein